MLSFCIKVWSEMWSDMIKLLKIAGFLGLVIVSFLLWEWRTKVIQVNRTCNFSFCFSNTFGQCSSKIFRSSISLEQLSGFWFLLSKKDKNQDYLFWLSALKLEFPLNFPLSSKHRLTRVYSVHISDTHHYQRWHLKKKMGNTVFTVVLLFNKCEHLTACPWKLFSVKVSLMSN